MVSMTQTSSRRPTKCILFDLDGTLVDTAPDLVHALNAVLNAEGCDPLPFKQARATASHGSAFMLKHAFGDMDEAQLAQRQAIFLDYYANNIAVDSVLFPGIRTHLEHLEANSISWGVVTNKPEHLTNALLRELGLLERACSVIGGDTLDVAKPHPKPLREAASRCGVDPKHCLYVGDAERDITAGRDAGMLTLLASYGYIGTEDDIQSWGADGIIQHPAEIQGWLLRDE